MRLPFRLADSLLIVWGAASAFAQTPVPPRRPPTPGASMVIVTVAGTVQSGTNGNPNSSPPGAGAVFGGASDLSGNPFTLTITFDPSEGTNSSYHCSDGTLNQSSNQGSDTAAAPTAVLQIGEGSYSYGTRPLRTIDWLIYREAPTPCTGYNSVGFGWSEGYTGNYSGGSGFGNIYLYASSPNFLSGDWRSPIPNTLVDPADFQFNITLRGVAPDGTQSLIAYAYGELTATNITVSGPVICSAGDSPVLPPPTPGVAEHEYVVKDFICSPLLRPSSLSCTAENVFSVLREFPTPVDEGHKVNTCDVTYIPPIISFPPGFPFASTLADVSYVGHVITYVDSSALSITNVTLPDHTFYPGQVTRSVISENGDIYIQSVGTGTGPNEPWNTEAVWEIIGPLVWHSADTDIFRRFNEFPLRAR